MASTIKLQIYLSFLCFFFFVLILPQVSPYYSLLFEISRTPSQKINGNEENVANYMNRLTRDLHDGTSDLIKFISPGHVLTLQGVKDKPRIIKTFNGDLFVLVGRELSVIINFEFHRVFLMDFDPLGDIEVISWKDLTIFVVAQGDSYVIYAKKTHSNAQGSRVQKLVFPSQMMKKSRFFVKNEELFLLAVTGDSDKGKLSLYKWHESEQHLILLNEIETGIIDDLFVDHNEQDPLLITVSYAHQRASNKKTFTQIYHVSSDKLTLLQQLFFQSQNLHAFNLHQIPHLLECSTRHICIVHKFSQGKFSKLHQVDRKFQQATKVISASSSSIAILMPDQLIFYQVPSLNQIAASSNLLQGLINVFFYKNQEHEFLVLFHVTAGDFHVRFLQMEMAEVSEVVGASNEPETHQNKFDASPVKQKLNDLRAFLEQRQPIANDILNVSMKVLRIDRPAKIENLRILNPLRVAKGNIEKINVLNEALASGTSGDLLKDITWLARKTNDLKNAVEEATNETQTRVRREFKDNFKASKMIVKNLHYNGAPFKRLIRRNGTARTRSFATIGTLRTKKLTVQDNIINQLPLLEVAKVSDTAPESFTKIIGVKEFNSIKTTYLFAGFVNDKRMPPIRTLRKKRQESSEIINSDVETQNLEVNSINGIPWTEFVTAMDFKDNPRIGGHLIVTQPTKVGTLKVEAVNGIPVNELMTRHTDQEIYSEIEISKFFSENIATGRVNGINFKEDVALMGQENHIKSRVVIMNMNVTNGLRLPDEHVGSSHVVGTRPEDLSQHYFNPVVIRGSLTVNRIITEPGCTVLVKDEPFYSDIENYFWVQNAPQTIPYFNFQKRTQVPQLFASLINDHPATDYLFTNSTPAATKRGRFAFRHVTVHGDVNTSDGNTQLSQIDRNIIRRGTTGYIRGKIRFEDEVRVDSLNTQRINSQQIEYLALQGQQNYDFKGTKRINKVHINGPLGVDGKFHVQNFNGTDMAYFFANALRIDEPIETNSISFDAAKIQNLNVGTIQGVDFNQFLSNLNSVLNSSASLRNIRVNRDIFFENPIEVHQINGIPVTQYLSSIVQRQSLPSTLYGHKSFENLIINENMKVNSINNYNLNDWMAKAVKTNENQVISGYWTFENLKTKKLFATVVDGVHKDEFLYANKPDQIIYGDVEIDQLNVQNLHCNLPIEEILFNIQYPLTPVIEKLIVEGPVYYPVDYKSKFTDILSDAVLAYGDQVINGKVTFINRPYFESIKSHNGLINDLDPIGIYGDALKYTGEKQEIYAPKTFKGQIETRFFIASIKVDVSVVNNIDIVALNNTLARRNERHAPIYGHKTFLTSPIVQHLHVKGPINGVDFDNIAFIQDYKTIPKAAFTDLSINENLIIENVNGRPLKDFILGRARLHGPPQEFTGSITFQNLIISGLFQTQAINHVRTEDLVLLYSETTQRITAEKTISSAIFDGPVTCSHMNGIDFMDFIQKNVKVDVDERIPVLHGKVVTEGGLEILGTFNGRPINEILDVKAVPVKERLRSLPEVKEIVQSTQERVQGKVHKRFLYFDHAADIQVFFNPENFEEVHEHLRFVMDGECSDSLEVKISGPSTIYVKKLEGTPLIKESKSVKIEAERGEECLTKGALKVHKEGIDKIFEYSPSNPLSNIEILPNLIVLFGGNEVQTLAHSTLNFWLPKQQIFDGVAMKIVTFGNDYFLLILAKKRELEVFYLKKAENWFESLESLPGKFNLISNLIHVGEEKMFALGLKNSKSVTIYKLIENQENPPLVQLFQTMRFEMRMKSLAVFEMEGNSHLVVIMTNGNFIIYRYSPIDGWATLTESYFEGMQAIMNFEHLNKEYLLLASSEAAAVVRVYQQS